MISDPRGTAGLVTREVRNATRDGRPTKVVVARRSYPTDQADLWNAITDRERLPRWFAPVSGELRLGGRFQVEGNAGGVVEHCDEPESFRITWEMGEQVSWVAVTLTPAGDTTVLELAHESWADDPAAAEFWARYGPGAVGVGWDLALLGLALHVDTGAPVDPEIATGFTFSPEGKTFVEVAAAGWADGAIGAGDDPTAARDAAARTVAFYTTDPSEGGEQPS